MSNNVKLQVLLRAVDQASRPFKSIRTASKSLSGDIRETQKSLRELNGQASRIEGFRKTSAQLAVTGHALEKARQEAEALATQFKNTERPTRAQAKVLESAKRAAEDLQAKYNRLTDSVKRQQRELAAVPEAQHGGFQAVVLRGVVDEPAVVGQRRRAHRQAGEGVVGRIGPVDDLPERKLVVEGRHAAQYIVPAGRSAVLRFQLPEMVHVEMGQQEVVERILVRHEMPHIPGVGAGRTREAVRLLGHAAVLFRFAAELTRIHRERRAVGQDEESALPAGRVDGVDVQTAFAPRREGFADPGLSAAASGGQNDRREQQQNEYPCFFHHFLI